MSVWMGGGRSQALATKTIFLSNVHAFTPHEYLSFCYPPYSDRPTAREVESWLSSGHKLQDICSELGSLSLKFGTLFSQRTPCLGIGLSISTGIGLEGTITDL